ncbi:MAG: hypothetical protein HEP71_16805 [Roseivirga sp.]|nr:hypothetical protein [Roseivirga sp.]
MIRLSSFLFLFLGLTGTLTPEAEIEIRRVETTIAYESFEGTVDELGYTSNDWNRSFSDYAAVLNSTVAGNPTPADGFGIHSGIPANVHNPDGGTANFYGVDDLDDSGNIRDDDLAIITFNNVDVTGATDLKLKLLLGTDRADRFETDDYFQIYYAFDTDITAHPGTTTAFSQGAYTLLADYRGSGSGTNASRDADFSGAGDGTEVLPFGTADLATGGNNDMVMSDISFDLAGTGSSLSIRFVFQTDSGDETFLIDNIRVAGEVPASAPTSATLAATAFIEGAYNGTDLNTTLNASIPTTQPYSFNGHAAGETAGAIPANAVDWVLVELREAASAAAALSATKVGSAAGFLMNDGTIKATDGTSDLTVALSGNTGSEFFVVVYHRNHLAIMSANAIADSGGTYNVDFTTLSSTTYQTTTALTTLSTGKFAMPAGDADGDGDVDATDLSTWRGQNGKAFSYNTTNGDFNLDGEINAVDRNDFQQKNNSKSTQVPNT